AHCFSCAATSPKDGTWDPVRLVRKMQPEMSRYDALLFVEKLFDLPALPDEPGGDPESAGRKPRGWIYESLDRLRLICTDCLEKKRLGSQKCLDYLRTRQLDLDVVLASDVIGAVPADLDVLPIIESAQDLYSKHPLDPLFSAEEMAKASATKREKWAEIERERLEREQKIFEGFVESLRKVPGYA